MVDITGLDKAEVLLTLWRHSHVQGMSFLGTRGHDNGLTLEEAKELVYEGSKYAFKKIEPMPLWTDNEALNEIKMKEWTQKFNEWFNDTEKEEYRLYFDYVCGHVIKCDLGGNAFNPNLYDRDCGEGCAQMAIDALRNGTDADYEYDPMMDLIVGMFKTMADEAELKENKMEENENENREIK